MLFPTDSDVIPYFSRLPQESGHTAVLNTGKAESAVQFSRALKLYWKSTIWRNSHLSTAISGTKYLLRKEVNSESLDIQVCGDEFTSICV